MITFKTIRDTQYFLTERKRKGKSVGFVPTMGALHEGHLELMRRAKRENDLLAVSIFVNPIQFNNPEDLEKYPRDLERDERLLRKVGCDLLFAPEVEEVYPAGDKPETYNFGALEKVMEGAFRPGHFNGVAVVVKRLFDIVRPDRAYFGEKDFQQLTIIKKLVQQEQMKVKIVPCPIVREADGLAMSSRNVRLTPNERRLAPEIHRILSEAVRMKEKMSPAELTAWVKNRFEQHPAFRLEYFEIADEQNLQPVEYWDETPEIMGFVAVYLGKVRLIDNIRF